MKKIFFAACILLGGCAFTNQQKAEKLVKQYMTDHVDDPSGYEPIRFTNLDTIKTDFLDDPAYKRANDSLALIVSRLSSERAILKSQNLVEPNKAKMIMAHLLVDSESYVAKKDSIEKHSRPKPTAWSITHTFRAKNRLGLSELHRIVFEINLACDTVLVATNGDK